MIDKIDECIKRAELGQSKLIGPILNLHGFSGTKGRHFLNNLGELTKQHLEVGTYQGTTLVSSAYQNPGNFCGLDNFCQFGGKDVLMNSLNLYCPAVKFIDYNWDEVPLDILPKEIDFYFYDAAHGYDDHLNALLKVFPNLAKTFIFVVDDWNGVEAKTGTMDSITQLDKEVKLIKQWDIGDTVDSDGQGWWNGFGIFLMEKI